MRTHKNCLVCKRINLIKKGKNPYFVKELKTGYVVLGDYQYYKGYSLLLCKKHTSELHKLTSKFRIKFLEEMCLLAEAVYKGFRPEKLNYELLGNAYAHLHWHIFPRHKNDKDKNSVTWVTDKSIRYSEKAKPSKQELKRFKIRLLAQINKLEKVGVVVEGKNLLG